MSASFFELYQSYQEFIVDDYFTLSRAAEAERGRDNKAAREIQKIWRGYRTRKWHSYLRNQATLVQMVYRGFIGRKKTLKTLNEKLHIERMAFYNAKAIIIQKIWKGYYSRKNVHDFYARKAYIRSVSDKGHAMQELLKDHEQRQKDLVEKLEQQQKEEKYKELAGNLHHLLGTHAVPGIYSPRKESLPLPSIIIRQRSDVNFPEKHLPHPPHHHLNHHSNLQPGGGEHVETLNGTGHGTGSGAIILGAVAVPRHGAMSPFVRPHDSSLRRHRKPIEMFGKNPEEHIVASKQLKEFVEKNIHHHWGKYREPPKEISEAEAKKIVPGPFLPIYRLKELKEKELSPSLRVQSEYTDDISKYREELRKQREQQTGQYFNAVVRPKTAYIPLIHTMEPYKIRKYGRKTFRD